MGLFDMWGINIWFVMNNGFSQKLVILVGVGILVNLFWSVYEDLRVGMLVQVFLNYYLEDLFVLWLVYLKLNVLMVKVWVFIDFLIEKIGKVLVWKELWQDSVGII